MLKPATLEPRSSGEPEVEVIDPLQRDDWDSLLPAGPPASFFHGSAWARVLCDTYGHRPLYLCRFKGGRMRDVLPLMEVSSRLTGRRGVSLPFTDCCVPLSGDPQGGGALCEAAVKQGSRRRWRYLECRGRVQGWSGAEPSLSFLGHTVDLVAGQDVLWNRLEAAVRRAIRKAETAPLKITFETTEESMLTFYQLHVQTRRRHGVPPQPLRFFQNIVEYVMKPGKGFIATASLGSRPVAAAVFFRSSKEAIYKFGASDFGFQHLRANNLVMWEAIKRFALEGFSSLHMGRTSLANEGLRRFKLGFGAREEQVEYFKFDFRKNGFVTKVDRAESWISHVFRLLPAPLFRFTGRLLYPHLS